MRKHLMTVCFALLSGCSSSFLYNQLDWLIPWYVDDYVDLTRTQKQDLKQQLLPLLEWHRSEELAAYLVLLDRIEGDLKEPVAAETIQEWLIEAERAWYRVEERGLPIAFGLGDNLSDSQMQEFLEKLRERQQELEEEYLERDDDQYREESYENFSENLVSFLGRLSSEQKERLRDASAELQRFDDVWLAERRAWIETLEEILAAREPGWHDAVREAIDTRRRNQSPEYQAAYQFNQEVINRAIADVLNSRSEKQSARLQGEIDDLRRTLNKLIKQS